MTNPQKQTAIKLVKELKLAGFIVSNVVHSTTDYGNSSYVNFHTELIVHRKRKFRPSAEVRISDHPCGAKHSLLDHIYGDSQISGYVEGWVDHANKIRNGGHL